ncbi:hypothetical protein BC830DRAFT_1232642 [Chytriomyces sp. MP71]|nr:hypothetical protein BC830DRAFT_1232642 [Chytriomyces sp. MP71]
MDHYTAEDVMAASSNLDDSYSLLLLVASIVNLVSILAFAFLSSAIVTWAVASLGDRAINLCAAAVTDLAFTAGSLARARIDFIAATECSGVPLIWGYLDNVDWRDGRLKIPVPAKKGEVE